MKKINKISILTYVLITFFILLNILSDLNIIKPFMYFKTICLLFISLIIFIKLKTEYVYKKYTLYNIKEIAFYLVLILFIYFLTGIIFGYSYNVYDYSLKSIVNNVINIILFQILKEYIRSYLIIHNSNKKVLIYIITFIMIIFDINFKILISNLSSNKSLFIYLFNTLLPIILRNILLTKINIKYGMLCSIFYVMIYYLFIIFTPLLPNLGYYFNFIFTNSIFVFSYYLIINNSKKRSVFKNNNSLIYKVSFFVLLILILCFNFGVFKYKPVGVISNSMKPVFKRGYLVIYKSLNNSEITKLKKGDIIVFNYDNDVYIHRINRVIKNEDNYSFITKGDANANCDHNKTKDKDVLGKLKVKIPYIGYPSVLINEILSK